MSLISLNYLSFLYLVFDMINALTWVIIFYHKISEDSNPELSLLGYSFGQVS